MNAGPSDKVDAVVLCVDVGATSIKSRPFSAQGVGLETRTKRPTPRPCEPTRLVELIAARVHQLGARQLGVGFPGEIDDGVVLDAANLARRNGPGSPVDPGLYALWNRFELADALVRATNCEVVVDNDAVMAGRGCLRGPGREIVVTLGSGCGFALADEGVLVPTRDLGGEEFHHGVSYDEALGERARRESDEMWLANLIVAIDALASEFVVARVHLAGGNARRLSVHDFGEMSEMLVIERDDPALIGAWRCFYS
jgi:polyphosphate glucokinase